MSTNWHLDGDPAPRLLVLPPAAASLDEAHAAIELWEHYKRRTLDPTQRLAVEVMMATRSNGLWAAPTTGREMPRQNGKGDEIEVVELWGLMQRLERILHTVHDAVLLASQAQERLLSMIEGHPDLRRKMLRRWRGTGQQMIEMRSGAIIWYRTRTGGGARGVDEVDRVVIDEAQHAELEHIAAVTPTTLASVNPQLNAIGSAGIEGKSVWWWQQRLRALRVDPGDFGYVGHTAEVVEVTPDGIRQHPVDPTDRALWWETNPALHAGRGGGEPFLAEQLDRLGPALFAREHLGVWDPPPASAGGGPIGVSTWEALIDATSKITGPMSFALDASPDRRWACFAVAGRRSDGLIHIEVTGTAEVLDHRPGTDWVVARGVELWKKWKTPIRIETGSPAASFIASLREAGVTVKEVSPAEHAQALGMLLDAVSGGTLRHRGQQAVSSALAGAVLRKNGESDKWGRRTSKVDITPLVAVTLALGGIPEPAGAGVRVAIVLG